jgi:hypothetical protein
MKRPDVGPAVREWQLGRVVELIASLCEFAARDVVAAHSGGAVLCYAAKGDPGEDLPFRTDRRNRCRSRPRPDRCSGPVCPRLFSVLVAAVCPRSEYSTKPTSILGFIQMKRLGKDTQPFLLFEQELVKGDSGDVCGCRNRGVRYAGDVPDVSKVPRPRRSACPFRQQTAKAARNRVLLLAQGPMMTPACPNTPLFPGLADSSSFPPFSVYRKKSNGGASGPAVRE